MNRSRFPRRTTLVLPLASLLAAFSCEQPLSPETEYALASQAVEQWADGHADGWELEVGGRTLARPEWSEPCSQNPPMGTVVLRYAAPDTEIDLHFRCPLNASSTARDLANAFQFVVLQKLPHGIRSPGWSFDVLTPVSSFSQGVTFPAAGQRELRVDIATQLYAISGHSIRKACEPPQDAPSAEGCYLVREYPRPLRLRIDAVFNPAALE